MTCEEIREHLNEYIDGELSKEETLDFDMHLYECEDCKKRYMALKEIGEAVRETRCTDLPEDFEITIPKENRIVLFFKKYQKTAAVMAAALALILIAAGIKNMPNYITHNDNKTGTQTEEQETPAEALTDGAAQEQIAEDTGSAQSGKKDTAGKKTPNTKDKKEGNKAASNKENGQKDNAAPAKPGEEAAQDTDTQSAAVSQNTAESRAEASKTQDTEAANEAVPAPEAEYSEDTEDGSASLNSYASDNSNNAAKSAGASSSAKTAGSGGGGAPAKTVDLSPVLSYSIPSAESFANPDLYSGFSSRLSSLKSRASSASDGEKQAILNEFNSLRAEISYNLK